MIKTSASIYALDYIPDKGIQYENLSKNRTQKFFNSEGNEAEDIWLACTPVYGQGGSFEMDSIVVYR